jgi:hypothetical protein
MSTDPLTTAALLGTGRMTVFPPASHEVLNEAWANLPVADGPRAVLQAAALEVTARRAGYQPASGIDLPEPAREEDVRPVPPAGVAAVHRMLAGEYAQGLVEWLRVAAASGLSAPARLLPPMFALGTRRRELRPLIRQVAGTRGVWLARRRKTWNWVVEEATVPDEAWDDGSPAERLAWLRQTRKADPARAVAAIADEWGGESPDGREAIVTMVAEHPLPEDGEWLESLALKDRRQATRTAAVAALLGIPESAFRQRVLERAARLLRVTGRGRKRVLTLEPPKEFDPAWVDDDIREKAPQGTGEKAWWSRQILAQVPLSAWPELLGLESQELFVIPRDSDWGDTILLAWTDALRRRPEMLDEFLPSLMTSVVKLSLTIGNVLRPVLEQLEPQGISEVLERLRLPSEEMLALLVRFQPPLDQKRTPRLFELVTAWWSTKSQAVTRPEAAALAFCVDPASIPMLLERIAKFPDLGAAAEEFARAIEFRQTYLPHLTNQS